MEDGNCEFAIGWGVVISEAFSFLCFFFFLALGRLGRVSKVSIYLGRHYGLGGQSDIYASWLAASF